MLLEFICLFIYFSPSGIGIDDDVDDIKDIDKKNDACMSNASIKCVSLTRKKERKGWGTHTCHT